MPQARRKKQQYRINSAVSLNQAFSCWLVTKIFWVIAAIPVPPILNSPGLKKGHQWIDSNGSKKVESGFWFWWYLWLCRRGYKYYPLPLIRKRDHNYLQLSAAIYNYHALSSNTTIYHGCLSSFGNSSYATIILRNVQVAALIRQKVRDVSGLHGRIKDPTWNCRVPTSIHVLITVVPIGEMIATKGAPTWLDEVDGGSAVSSLSGCAPRYEQITWRLRKDAVPTIRALAIVKKMGSGWSWPSAIHLLSDLQRESMLTLIWKKCQAVTCLHEHPIPGFFRLGSRPELLAVFAVDDWWVCGVSVAVLAATTGLSLEPHPETQRINLILFEAWLTTPPSLSQTCQRRTIRMIRAIRTIKTATMPRRKLRFLRSLGVTMSRMLRMPRRMQMRPRKGRHPHPPHPLRSPRSKSGSRPGVARSRPLHRCPPAPGAEKAAATRPNARDLPPATGTWSSVGTVASATGLSAGSSILMDVNVMRGRAKAEVGSAQHIPKSLLMSYFWGADYYWYLWLWELLLVLPKQLQLHI